MGKETTEHLIRIHYRIKDFADARDKEGLKNYLESLNKEESTCGELRIALIICKDIRNFVDKDLIPDDIFENMKKLLFSKTNSKY